MRERERERERERGFRNVYKSQYLCGDTLIIKVCIIVISCYLSPAQMYRITVRTSNEAVSRKICDILSEQF